MKPEAKLEVASNSRLQAETYLNKSNFGRAFAHYLVALNLCPEWKPELKFKFSSTLCSWGAELETQKRYKDLFHCYEQALEVFPESEEVLNNLGAHLYRLGHVREASHYFRKALMTDPDFLPARRNLQIVSNSVVERWHFRMLNDRLRNEAFREAIFKKVKQKFDTVLDIGTGTGILSMFAATAGAQSIYGCDVSPTMFQIASDVLKANNLSTKVHLLNKLSHDLKIPKDLPERVSLVVTETMDCGLLGEQVLSTLSDAWKRLLLPPCPGFRSKKSKVKQESKEDEITDGNKNESQLKEQVSPSEESSQTWNRCFWRHPPGGSILGHGIVIPFGAAVCLAAIESPSLSLRYNLLSTAYLHQHLNIPNTVTATAISNNSGEEDLYDAEDLHHLPGGYRYLVEPKEAIYVNFNDPEEIEARLSGSLPPEVLQVNVLSSGRLDAVAAWFILDVDEDIKLVTAPGKGSCWEQALYPLYPPIAVTEGQTVQYVITNSGKKLAVKATVLDDTKCNILKEARTSSGDVPKDISQMKVSVSNTSESSSEALEEHENSLTVDFKSHSTKESASIKSTSELKVSPHVAKSAMSDCTSSELLMNTTTSGLISSPPSKNLCLSENIVAFLNNDCWIKAMIDAADTVACTGKREAVLDMNPFPVFGLMLLKLGATKRLVWSTRSGGSERVEEERVLREVAAFNGIEADCLKCEPEESLQGEFDLIFCDMVDPQGELQEAMIGKLPSLLQMLKSNGILLPKRITVVAQLLFSEWLARMSQVMSDENVCNYKTAEFMNVYKVPQHLDVNMNALTKDACNDPMEVLSLDIRSLGTGNPTKSSTIVEMPVPNECHVNAIAHWYNVELLEDLWVSSFGVGSHLKQAATLLPSELLVRANEKVSIKIIHHQGLLYFQLSEAILQSGGTIEDFKKKLNIQDM